ncbi:MAG TPA: hypothetical protein PK054_09305 [Anaerohalosphaeraceae bacterium]|nr:hypothetical protein [Anaerohalosphaeraceae bacterium]HOL89319.1 hypothetical protein [Anaerohalosphaeraceae bacterium]HPP56758.1 hypothetical protein [Anaerohalosphaeraceae bacterium]
METNKSAGSEPWEEVFMPLFEERQRFGILLQVPLWAGIAVFGGVILFLQFKGALSGALSGLLWLCWALMAAVDGLLASGGMLTRVRKEGIEVVCLPLTLLRKRIAWEEIERLYARTYSPISEYGGWGIRYGQAGTAYNIRGNQGIQLELKNGKRILIGTQQPQKFLEAVRSAAPGKT